MRVLLVDDHSLLRQSLAAYLLREDPGIDIHQARDYDEALREMKSFACDVLVTDLSMGQRTGLELIAEIVAERSCPAIVALSMHEDLEHLSAAFRAGARGYVAKSSDASELRAAIRAVAAGGFFLDQTMLALALSRLAGIPAKRASECDSAFDSLTEREREVFLCLAKNQSIEETGKELNISSKTVENHRGAVYAKLGLSDRLSLYHYARKLGLTD